MIDLGANINQDRDGPQSPKHTAWSQGIADALFDAVLLRNFDIELISIEAALLEGSDHIVRSFNGLLAIESRDDRRFTAAAIDHRLNDLTRLLQPLSVDVHQSDGAVAECRR